MGIWDLGCKKDVGIWDFGCSCRKDVGIWDLGCWKGVGISKLEFIFNTILFSNFITNFN